MDDESKNLREFSEELAEWLVPQLNKYQDPLLIGAAMVRVAMGLYTASLKDEEIERLLDVVAESLPEIREASKRVSEMKRTIH